MHIFWPSFTFSTSNLAPFLTWSTTSTNLLTKTQKPPIVGLIQMQCSTSFDCNWGKQNNPIACWQQLYPWFQVLQQGKCLSYTPDCVGGVTETPNCMSGCAPFESTLKGGWKPSTFFNNFHGVMPDNNCEHFECFVMLGTHSKLHRGQVSHICVISNNVA